jgi:hypothetical protein
MSLSIDEIKYDSSAKTTVYLQNHITTLLPCLPKKRPNSHNINANEREKVDRSEGVHEIESDCELPSDDEGSAEDLTEVDEKLEKKKR